jgi:beta-galactosidase
MRVRHYATRVWGFVGVGVGALSALHHTTPQHTPGFFVPAHRFPPSVPPPPPAPPPSPPPFPPCAVLCNTDGIDWVTAAQEAKAVYHTVDHASGRPVSANQNGWIGPNTPLDVQGFDYSTGSYDGWHKAAPNIPSISSETSSAVSDRGEYANDPNGGHVEGYDRDAPGWGQTAQGAWGGIGESNGQGILTRDFISGGWTWTGMDYRGEPTPYGWPDVNSHFGILDLAMFPKDRTHWYMSWFPTVDAANLSAVPVHLHVFPPWEGWTAGQSVSVWAFSNADAVELFVNDVSAGVQNMTQYAHVEWAVPFAPGDIRAVAYRAGVAVATMQRNTTGAPAAVVAEIKDGWGAQLVAGCKDFAFISAAIVDASGQVVHTASNDVTFTVSGPATLEGTSNGDPASLVNNKSPTRPAYHGLVLGAVNGPPAGATGPVVVTVSSPGLTPATVTIPVVADDGSSPETWCHREQRL